MKKVKVETSGMVREIELEEISISGIKKYIQERYLEVHDEMILTADGVRTNNNGFHGNLFYTVRSKYGSSAMVFDVTYSEILKTVAIQSIYLNFYDLERLNQMSLTA